MSYLATGYNIHLYKSTVKQTKMFVYIECECECERERVCVGVHSQSKCYQRQYASSKRYKTKNKDKKRTNFILQKSKSILSKKIKKSSFVILLAVCFPTPPEMTF